jgi:arylsulfatase
VRVPQHVVLVTIDTLRADRLGSYGSGAPTSPFLDSLARRALVFENAVSTAPSTAPSIASLLTGLHRASHGVRGNGGALPEGIATLAEALRTQGFHTVARIANPLLEAPLGFAQGFDDFAMPADLRQAPPVVLDGAPLVAEARRVIGRVRDGERLFLWLHFYDPHGPYFPPDRYRALFDPAAYRWPGDSLLPPSEGHVGLRLIPLYQAVSGETDPASYRARYDAEVRYVDDHVRAVVEALRERGLFDETLFVLTSDHGESLGEHNLFFQHGWFTYADAVHVPLLLLVPGLEGRRVSQSVSLIDVAPTILDLVELPLGPDVEGTSLRSLFAGEGPDRLAFAQSYHGTGSVLVRAGRLDYVFRPARGPGAPLDRAGDAVILPEQPQHELYDWSADPAEAHDLAAAKPEQRAVLERELRRWLAEQHARDERLRAARAADGPATLDPIVESQLRALGYAE